MFHTPGHCFVAKLSVGREARLFLLAAANSNSRGTHSIRRPGNESEEALSNGHDDLQGAGPELIGCAAKRVVDRLKERSGEQSREAGGPPPLASNEAQRVGGRARRSSS